MVHLIIRMMTLRVFITLCCLLISVFEYLQTLEESSVSAQTNSLEV